MILKKKVNQFSDEIIDIEVLDRDTIREKINNLDLLDIKLNYEELEMFNTLTGEWIKMDYTDALDYVIDRFNLDVDKRLRDFCMTDGLDYVNNSPLSFA